MVEIDSEKGIVSVKFSKTGEGHPFTFFTNYTIEKKFEGETLVLIIK